MRGGGGGGGGGGEFTRGAAMYVKLFQLGGGGGVRSASQMNQFVTHMHAFFTKTQRTSGQKGPLRSCPVVLHRICP